MMPQLLDYDESTCENFGMLIVESLKLVLFLDVIVCSCHCTSI